MFGNTKVESVTFMFLQSMVRNTSLLKLLLRRHACQKTAV